jgi:hypothetical protein
VKTTNWYEANMGNNHQGLVIEEETGRNVAVAYDKADARLISAAPELLAVCEKALSELEALDKRSQDAEYTDLDDAWGTVEEVMTALREAIDKAKGQS